MQEMSGDEQGGWRIRRLVRLVGVVAFASYVAALLGLGAFGALAPRLELHLLYNTTVASDGGESSIVILHQYRFLKVFAIGFGLWALTVRRAIFRDVRCCTLFLFVLFAAATARMLSVVTDGMPPMLLISFAASEYVFGLCILAAALTHRRRSPA